MSGMARSLAAAGCGALFGLGLLLSGMIDPRKVLGFLDVAGRWDPSLALVMAGAIPMAATGFALGRRRARPVCAPAFAARARQTIDARLVAGAVLFGAGWGLTGYCPGPALAGLGIGPGATWLFVAAMLGGMIAESGLSRRRRPAPVSAAAPMV